ncbi:MAG: ferredoxin [Actinomycetota bacterium]
MGSASGYEVVVDQSECVSAGKCVASAPGFFVFDADQIATVEAAGPRPDDATLLRIARSCPSGAIRLLLDGAEIEI